MQWTSAAILLSVRPHGETSGIAEVMTPQHGRCLGLVKGARSRRLQPVLQPGNALLVTWRARLESQLGLFTVELEQARAARLMESASGVYGLQALAAHLRYLAERDPHQPLYEAAVLALDHLGDAPLVAAALLARFELLLLEELGFGLDLTSCVATGRSEDLVYVSPKSARAVCRDAGQPYARLLLPLPAFLRDVSAAPSTAQDVADALRLTGFFLVRNVAEPRSEPLPAARAKIVDAVAALAATERRDRLATSA